MTEAKKFELVVVPRNAPHTIKLSSPTICSLIMFVLPVESMNFNTCRVLGTYIPPKGAKMPTAPFLRCVELRTFSGSRLVYITDAPVCAALHVKPEDWYKVRQTEEGPVIDFDMPLAKLFPGTLFGVDKFLPYPEQSYLELTLEPESRWTGFDHGEAGSLRGMQAKIALSPPEDVKSEFIIPVPFTTLTAWPICHSQPMLIQDWELHQHLGSELRSMTVVGAPEIAYFTTSLNDRMLQKFSEFKGHHTDDLLGEATLKYDGIPYGGYALTSKTGKNNKSVYSFAATLKPNAPATVLYLIAVGTKTLRSHQGRLDLIA